MGLLSFFTGTQKPKDKKAYMYVYVSHMYRNKYTLSDILRDPMKIIAEGAFPAGHEVFPTTTVGYVEPDTFGYNGSDPMAKYKAEMSGNRNIDPSLMAHKTFEVDMAPLRELKELVQEVAQIATYRQEAFYNAVIGDNSAAPWATKFWFNSYLPCCSCCYTNRVPRPPKLTAKQVAAGGVGAAAADEDDNWNCCKRCCDSCSCSESGGGNDDACALVFIVLVLVFMIIMVLFNRLTRAILSCADICLCRRGASYSNSLKEIFQGPRSEGQFDNIAPADIDKFIRDELMAIQNQLKGRLNFVGDGVFTHQPSIANSLNVEYHLVIEMTRRDMPLQGMGEANLVQPTAPTAVDNVDLEMPTATAHPMKMDTNADY